MEIVTTETLPVTASMSGNNTIYHYCEQLERRSSYGLCLYTLKAYEEGKLPLDNSCHTCIMSGQCPALALRQQERDAGRALFFKPREYWPKETFDTPSKPRAPITRPTQPNNASYMRGWNAAGRSSTPSMFDTPKPAPRPKPVEKSASEKMFGVKEVTLTSAISDAALTAFVGPKDAPTPLLQHIAKLIRSKDRDAWRADMTTILTRLRLSRAEQAQLVEAAKTLANSKHALDNASIAHLETTE